MTRISAAFLTLWLVGCAAQRRAVAPEAVAECMASHITIREQGATSLAGIQVGSPIQVVADVCRHFRGLYSCQAQCPEASVIAWNSSPCSLPEAIACPNCSVADAASVAVAAGSSWRLLPRLPAVVAAYHFGYGIGSLLGWADVLAGARHGRAWFARLTR